jgi:3-hydroxyacyl-CoA dehydrogenase
MSGKIEKAAILGSGVMGSGIAAHLANAGIPSVMLDIVPREPTPKEAAAGLTLESPAVRNRLGNEAIQRALKAKPAPFFDKQLASMVEVGNFEDDWGRIAEADWIIEVVKEDIEIKRKVLGEAAKHRKPGSIVSTNTSGLSIDAMASDLDDEFRRHFLGTHFFNPPRYLHLLEIIPGTGTDSKVVDDLEQFADRRLGKGIVVARDTPNFVANRVGVFAVLDVIRIMQEMGLTVEEVDFLTGPLIGHPKSATFRTADLVGLDTFVHVAGNVYHGCPDDESREMFQPPELMMNMLEKKMLGEKSGGGFYRRVKGPDGKKSIETLDLDSLEYREKQKAKFPKLETIRNLESLSERLPALVDVKGRAGEFTWKTASRLFQYCANRIGEICDDPVPMDHGLTWGFGWEMGPFEMWDALGFRKVTERMRDDGLELPEWIGTMLDRDAGGFYRLEEGRLSVWDPAAGHYRELPEDPGRIDLAHLKQADREIKQNAGASVVDLGDGVACLEFHSKMNSIGGDIVEMIGKALVEVEKNFDGLVVGNQGPNFSAGADLMMILLEAQEQNWDDIDLMIRAFQNATMSLKYAQKPVVMAPFGLCLGGGAELVLHGQRVRASAETYIGLVEFGAGVVPAGGGCKELYLRNLEHWTGTDNLLPVVQQTFETIGMAKVATRAVEGRGLRFLRDTDGITMNPHRLIADAKQTVLSMAREGWRPGRPRTDIPVMGRAGKAALEVVLFNMMGARYISEHDRTVGLKLGNVLCGGDLTGKQTVSEQYLLDLEREAFLSLLGERKTLERIQALLQTGKPLRN